MAHDIQKFDVVGADQEGTWHGLHVSLSDAYKQLQYRLDKVPAQLGDFVSQRSFFLVASDTGQPIADGSTVGADYTPLQLVEDRWPLIEAITKAIPGSHITTAGTIGNRADFFCSVAMPKPIGPKNDKSFPYVNLMGSNVGRRSEIIGARATRIVCRNTFVAALNENKNKGAHRAGDIVIRHTKSGSDRMKQAQGLVQQIMPFFESMEDTMKRLMAVRITPKGQSLFYDKVCPPPEAPSKDGMKKEEYEAACQTFERQRNRDINMKKCWFDNFEEERQALASDPNLWLAYNSATKWFQHQYNVRSADGANPTDARAYSNLWKGGYGFEHTIDARDAAVEFAAAPPAGALLTK